MKFKYHIELEEGYEPTMELEAETDICFEIEAKNRVTADRAVRALLQGATNIKDCVCSGICVD